MMMMRKGSRPRMMLRTRRTRMAAQRVAEVARQRWAEIYLSVRQPALLTGICTGSVNTALHCTVFSFSRSI